MKKTTLREKLVNRKEQELTPKSKWFKNFVELWLAVEQRLRNK